MAAARSEFRLTVEVLHELRRAGWLRSDRRPDGARRWVGREGREVLVYASPRRYVEDDPRSRGQILFRARGVCTGWYTASEAGTRIAS